MSRSGSHRSSSVITTLEVNKQINLIEKDRISLPQSGFLPHPKMSIKAEPNWQKWMCEIAEYNSKLHFQSRDYPGILLLLWHHPGIRMFGLSFFYRNISTQIKNHFLAQKWHSRILITMLLYRNLNAKHEILHYTMRKIQIICYHNSLWSVQVAIDHEPLLLILKSNIDKPDWKGHYFFTLGSFIIL